MAPSSAKSSATARPMPLAAPETTATLPFSRIALSCKLDKVFRPATVTARHLLKQRLGFAKGPDPFYNPRRIDSSGGKEVNSLSVVVEPMQDAVEREVLQCDQGGNKLLGRLIDNSN